MREVLQDLRNVAVRTAYRIRQCGTKRLSRKQIGALEVLAGAGITDHQISHDVFRFDKTLRNARNELGVTSTKVSKQWVWALPEA